MIKTLQEFVSSFKNYEFWLNFAWVDIRGRYRRTILGPFWSGLNSLIFVVILSTVYALLWKTDLSTFLPFVAAGYYTWSFFSTCISESYSLFHAQGELLKTTRLSPFLFLFRLITRNIIVYGHNLLIFLIIALFLNVNLSYIYLIIPAILIITLFSIGVAICIAFLCARFRDFEQIIASIMSILFYISPILWDIKNLPAHASYLAEYNGIYHLLVLGRDPLLGKIPPLSSWLIGGGMSAFALCLALVIYTKYRPKLAYWV